MIRVTLLLILFLGFATNVAAEGDESFVTYDSIVSELKATAEEPEPVRDDLNWEEVAIHGGVGFATSFMTVQSPEGVEGSGVLKGFAAHIGANLFSRKARAELTFRNYAQESLASDLDVNLREFELALIFLPVLTAKTKLRMGGGLAARFMDLSVRSGTGWISRESSTPGSSLRLGFEHKLSNQISIGPDLAYRSTMNTETFDKSAWDASFRLNATF